MAWIWCCHGCGLGLSCSSDITPSLGISVCSRGGCKKKKKKWTIDQILKLWFKRLWMCVRACVCVCVCVYECVCLWIWWLLELACKNLLSACFPVSTFCRNGYGGSFGPLEISKCYKSTPPPPTSKVGCWAFTRTLLRGFIEFQPLTQLALR